jgi:hypothetical protein
MVRRTPGGGTPDDNHDVDDAAESGVLREVLRMDGALAGMAR